MSSVYHAPVFLPVVLQFCDWREFRIIARLSRSARSVAAASFSLRIGALLGRFLIDNATVQQGSDAADALLSFAATTNSGIVGPFVLTVLAPPTSTGSPLNDLIILAPSVYAARWMLFLQEKLGFRRKTSPAHLPAYLHGHASALYVFVSALRNVHLVVTLSTTILPALLRFPSTGDMHLLSGGALWSFYPLLTDEGLSLATEYPLRSWEATALPTFAPSRALICGIQRVSTNESLARPFIPGPSRAIFEGALEEAGGGLVGSGVAWLSQPSPDWMPYDLNFVVAKDFGTRIASILHGIGYASVRIDSHIPCAYLVVPDGEGPELGHPSTERWMSKTLRFTDARGRIITVTSTKDPNVLRTLLGAESTMGMAILTGSALVILYPSLWRRNRAFWREGSIANSDSDVDRIATPQTWAQKGFEITPASTPRAAAACSPRCCSEPRHFRGGRGIAVIRMGPRTLPAGFARDAANGLLGGQYGMSLVLAACHNPQCRFFRFPAVSLRSPITRRLRPPTTNPKYDAIEARAWFVRHREPPFPRIYHALLLATNIHARIWVPLPLGDHALHRDDYRTIDDLRTSTWVKCNPEAAPVSPLFAAAGTAIGTPVFSNALTQMYSVLGTFHAYNVVLVFQSPHSMGEVNQHFHPETCNCPAQICGDVLAIFFRDGVTGPVQPSAVDVPFADCRLAVHELVLPTFFASSDNTTAVAETGSTAVAFPTLSKVSSTYVSFAFDMPVPYHPAVSSTLSLSPAFNVLLLSVESTEPVLVSVPVLALRAAPSVRDLDVSPWITVPGPAHSTDLDANCVEMVSWPPHSYAPLPYSYTIFCAPQTDSVEPLNKCLPTFVTLRPKWTGNILVARAAEGSGGVGNMTLEELSQVIDIVQYIVRERIIGFDLDRSHLDFPTKSSWQRKFGKSTLCDADTSEHVNVVVGMVSSAKYGMSGVGSWSPSYNETPIEKAKFNLVVENPESTEWLLDWLVVLFNAGRVQTLKCPDTKKQAHFVAEEDGQTVLRFTRPIFRSGALYADDHSQWPVPLAHKQAFAAAAAACAFELPVIYDADGTRLMGQDLLNTINNMPGCIVAVKFTLNHVGPRSENKYSPAKGVRNTHHSFLATFESIQVLQLPGEGVPFTGTPIQPPTIVVAPIIVTPTAAVTALNAAADTAPNAVPQVSAHSSPSAIQGPPAAINTTSAPPVMSVPTAGTPQASSASPLSLHGPGVPSGPPFPTTYALTSPQGVSAHLLQGRTALSSYPFLRGPTPLFAQNDNSLLYQSPEQNRYFHNATPGPSGYQQEQYLHNAMPGPSAYQQERYLHNATPGPSGYYNYPLAVTSSDSSSDTLSEDENQVQIPRGLGKTRPAPHQAGPEAKRARRDNDSA
ncbi:hypothetical protein C8F01DRAFT_1244430 [Mycena amicta]|nr:hypothetical protein C8F01DRAFT_1244430 [Mycena amicta]